MKTYLKWIMSNKMFSDYVKPGNEVDIEIVGHFRDSVPPVTLRDNVIQCGEPYSHDENGALYRTFKKVHNKWFYAGLYNIM